MNKTLLGITLAAAMIAGAPVRAQPSDMLARDHFRCYKVKDSVAKASYTATLIPNTPTLPVENGCTIRVPAKLLCDPVVKENLQPPPTNGLKTEILNNQLVCYKLKCGKTGKTVHAVDQFGTRDITVKKPTMLCAPVAPNVT
jgi:hypothetical protein